MATETPTGNRKTIVLCLGLLIGFVVGFVMLLSSLPISGSIDGYDVYANKQTSGKDQKYDFYNYLPGNRGRSNIDEGAKPVVREQVKKTINANQTLPAVVSDPVTLLVPANEQIAAPGYPKIPQTDAAAVNAPVTGQYAEVPANYANTTQQSYFLQVGRYGVHQDAQVMRAQVLLLGLQAFIVARVEADGVTAHRVRVGPYFDQNLLTEAKKRLRRGGIDYEIVRVTG